MANEILTEDHGRVRLITLNRPEARNAVNSALGQGPVAAIQEMDADAGITAGKYYPDGATTNSSGGVSSWRQIETALAAMEDAGMVLCIHVEDPAADVLDREEAFLPSFM